MISLTKLEVKVLLLLLKDFDSDYNANSISKKISVTPRGALKILKRLKKENLLLSKQMGKAVFYKINLKDDYSFKFMEMLLMAETKQEAKRWLFDFAELFPKVETAIIFGSASRNFSRAEDIDLLLVFKENKINEINKIISEKRTIFGKPIHLVKQSQKDLSNNIKNKDKVLLNILSKGYVLSGQNKLLEVLKYVTGF